MAGLSNVVALHDTAAPGSLWSINALAEEFGTGWNQVKRALRDVPADGKIKGKPAWRVGTAAPYLVQPPGESGGNKDPDKMDPKDRLDWVKSERELMKLRAESGQLVSVDEYRDALASVCKLFITALDTLPDVLEREAGLTPKQTERTQATCDSAREEIYKANARLADA